MQLSKYEKSPPLIGAVIPTTEVNSSITPGHTDSDILWFIKKLSDYSDWFAVVYHHTLLQTNDLSFTKPIQGETRHTSEELFPDVTAILTLIAQATNNMKILTGIMVTPQMQTAQVAQIASAIQNLSGGRFQLGVGVGWSKEEYIGLGSNDYHTRGIRLNKQIPVIEMLLAGKTATITLGEEQMNNQKISPHANKSVPILVGGWSKKSLMRAAKYGDGYIPMGDVSIFLKNKFYLFEQLEKFKRNISKFNIIGRITLGRKTIPECIDNYIEWWQAGVTHLALSTTGAETDMIKGTNYKRPEPLIDLIDRFSLATGWIRGKADFNFSELFSIYGPVEISEFGKEDKLGSLLSSKKLMCLKMNPDILEKHLELFLSANNFERDSSDIFGYSEITSNLISDNPLVLNTTFIDPDGKRVWILKSKVNKETLIIYNMEVENRVNTIFRLQKKHREIS